MRCSPRRRPLRAAMALAAAWGCGTPPAETAPDVDTEADTDSEPGTEADTGSPTAPELGLLALNLHCFHLDGTPFADHDARFAAIAALADEHDVGAIAAQEACRNEAHGDAVARLAAALEAATGAPWGSAWAFTHDAWTGTADEAEEGVALLVRGGAPGSPTEHTYAVQGTQLRKLLAADVLLGDGSSIRLVSVHLEHDSAAARLAQARESASWALARAPADWGVVLAGDLNARAADPPVTDLLAAGLSRLSAASDPDGERIDHVLAPAGAGLTAIEARLVLDGATGPRVSDHPGVLVRLRRDAPRPIAATRLVATHDAGFGHFLAVRGEGGPLSWTAGWPATNTADDRWEAVFLALPAGDLSYKWLRDDSAWETGPNRAAPTGSTQEVVPTF